MSSREHSILNKIIVIFSKLLWWVNFSNNKFIHLLSFMHQNRSDQSLSRVRLFATPWIAARQASLSITNYWSSPRLMSIESVMQSSHVILSTLSPPAPNPSQHQSLFQWVNSSHEVAKVLEFQLQHQSFQRTPGLISFRMDWLDLLAVQRLDGPLLAK